MQIAMLKLSIALLAVLFLCTNADHSLAGSTTPSSAVLQEIYKRYSPRLQGLTPAKVESIWRGQAQREPWFQQTYINVNAAKDSPEQVREFMRELFCEAVSGSRRDLTYAMAATQYRCTAELSVEGANVSVVLYMNLNDAGTLESFVFYQNVHGENVKQMVDAGLSQRDAMTLTELHFDVLSRIDNARAPSGSFVEYDKTGDTQKFAVRFK
jgi:hypothetical protein